MSRKQTIDEKEVRKRAKELLDQDIDKQKVYELLIDEFDNGIIAARILKRIPSSQAMKKYGPWNQMLLALMIILFLWLMFRNASIGIVIWYGLPIIGIYRMATRFYVWIMVAALIGVITMIALTINHADEMTSDVLIRMGIYFALLIPATVLALWLPRKLTPEPAEEREIYLNEIGEERSRMVYRFPDR